MPKEEAGIQEVGNWSWGGAEDGEEEKERGTGTTAVGGVLATAVGPEASRALRVRGISLARAATECRIRIERNC